MANMARLMRSRHATSVLMLVCALGAGAAQARDRDAGPQEPRPRPGMGESLRRIERESGGTVLSAQPQQRDGREVYRVKLITPQGRVRVLHEDPARVPRAEAQRPKIRQDGRRPYDE